MIDFDRLADVDGRRTACPGKGEPLEHRFVSGGCRTRSTSSAAATLHCVIRIPPPTAPGRPRRGHPPRVADHRGARRHRRAAHRGHRGVRRPVGARPHLLPDGLRRRLVADGHRRLAGAVRHRPRGARRASPTSSSRASRCSSKVDWQAKGLAGPRPPRRLPRAPGRPLDRVPRADQGPRAARLRRGVGVAARAPADRLHPRAHARRLPVRQRDVPARRAGAARRDRRLGDGHRRRPEARPRLGRAELARRHERAPRPPSRATST